jgi:hypothetical protein
MDILEKDYKDEHHIFVFDNATTHLKRPVDALSATKMPMDPSEPGKKWGKQVGMNFGAQEPVRDKGGCVVRDADGKIQKLWSRMRNGWFINAGGQKHSQSFYFPKGHVQAGLFNGTANILKARGFNTAQVGKWKAQCKKFACPPIAEGEKPSCCCQRVLYSEPNSAATESIIKESCRNWGFDILFLPKFHCKLNLIEQCWGWAKQCYCKLPKSSSEAGLECNVVLVLDAIPIVVILFFHQTLRFTEAYTKGLNGKQAAWVGKRYHGHRVLPKTLYNDMEEAGMAD